jgi:hypothetical protein
MTTDIKLKLVSLVVAHPGEYAAFFPRNLQRRISSAERAQFGR